MIKKYWLMYKLAAKNAWIDLKYNVKNSWNQANDIMHKNVHPTLKTRKEGKQ